MTCQDVYFKDITDSFNSIELLRHLKLLLIIDYTSDSPILMYELA